MWTTKRTTTIALWLVGVGAFSAGIFYLARGAMASPFGRAPTVYALIRFEAERNDTPIYRQPVDNQFTLLKRTHAALIKSRVNLLAALQRPEVAGLGLVRELANPVEWLEDALKVDFPNDANLLR